MSCVSNSSSKVQLLITKKVAFSEKCPEYSYFGHIEDPERVRKAYEILRRRHYQFLTPKPASEGGRYRLSDAGIEWVQSEVLSRLRR